MAVPSEKISDDSIEQYNTPLMCHAPASQSHQIDFGIGYATDTQFRLSATWRTPLINKYGHFQETKFEYSAVDPTGNFIYSIPLSHPTNDLFQGKLTVKKKNMLI